MAKEPDECFGQLMTDMVTAVQSETKTDEANRIHIAIHSYLIKWLKEIEEINPLFKVTELIGVGSYAEGTKIIEPNEFDYLAVTGEFSKPGLLSIDRNESILSEGYVKVKVEDDDLKSKCRKLCKKNHLQCFQPINFPDLGEQRFGHVFIEALKKYAKRNELRWGIGIGTPTMWTGTLQLPPVNNISLLLQGADYTVPNILIYFKYKGKKVTTDLTPAIRYHQPRDCFDVKDCVSPKFAELILSRQSLLLIGTRHECDFKITVTEAEVEYINKVMKAEHKSIYIFLKYITKLYKDKVYIVSPFTSYMLKTVCIHHDVNCGADKKSIRCCFESVIEDLMVCTQQGYFTSIVDKHIHIDSNNDVDFVVKDYRTSMVTDLKQMSVLPEGFKLANSFDEFVTNFVLKEKQKRDKENEDWSKMIIESNKKFFERIHRDILKLTEKGYGYEEAESAMRRSLDDPDLALKILQYEAERRMDKTTTEKDVNVTKRCSESTVTVPDCQSLADRSKKSTEETPCYADITEEIIYVRQKH